MGSSPTGDIDSQDIETECVEGIRDAEVVRNKLHLNKAKYKTSLWRRPISKRNSEGPSSYLSTFKNSDTAGLVTSGLDQLVQVSLFSDNVYGQKGQSCIAAVGDRTQIPYSRNSMSKSSWNTSMVTRGQIFDKNQMYRARLCGSTKDFCSHYALHGFGFCIKHILEDRLAPYKQCDFFEYRTQMRCPYPVCVNVVDAR